jgi:hypothetical protein
MIFNPYLSRMDEFRAMWYDEGVGLGEKLCKSPGQQKTLRAFVLWFVQGRLWKVHAKTFCVNTPFGYVKERQDNDKARNGGKPGCGLYPSQHRRVSAN